MRILVIEDHVELTRQVVSTLEHALYVADVAFDGELGHFPGNTEHYDACILDPGLPKMDGIDVLERQRTDGNPVPVLILTSRHTWRDKAAGLRAGADDCLSQTRIHGKQDAIGYRICVQSVIDDLSFAMKHIHRDLGITIELNSLQGEWIRGEAQDLEEMAGNLIDNAFKWAESRVVVSCSSEHNRLELIIEDDGPGIAEEELQSITQSGQKLDESSPGHGHVLGIVEDIAHLYGGSLKLGKSSLGGLQARLNLPSA